MRCAHASSRMFAVVVVVVVVVIVDAASGEGFVGAGLGGLEGDSRPVSGMAGSEATTRDVSGDRRRALVSLGSASRATAAMRGFFLVAPFTCSAMRLTALEVGVLGVFGWIEVDEAAGASLRVWLLVGVTGVARWACNNSSRGLPSDSVALRLRPLSDRCAGAGVSDPDCEGDTLSVAMLVRVAALRRAERRGAVIADGTDEENNTAVLEMDRSALKIINDGRARYPCTR